MPINSSSIPALRAARAAKRRRRAEGGSVFPEDIKRVHIRSDAPVGADESAMPGRSAPPWSATSAFGTLSPGEEAMSTQELGDSQSSNFISKAGSVIGGIAKGLFYDFPKNMIDRSVQNPQPGLRREDFTDIPPDTSPDPRSAFGGVGVDVPKVGWQPVDPMVGSSLEAASNIMGGTALTAPAAALGAGPVRRAVKAASELDGSEAARQARLIRHHADSHVIEGPSSSKEAGPFVTPKTVYHGRQSDFDAFDPQAMGTTSTTFGSEKTQRHGQFFAEDPDFAASFATQGGRSEGANIIPAHLNIKNPLYLHPEGLAEGDIAKLVAQGVDERWLRNHLGDPRSTWEAFDGADGAFFTDAMRKSGYDGAFFTEIAPETGKQQNIWMTLDPNQVRSKFAQFDPAKKDSSFLLGAGAADKRAAGVSVLDDIDGLLEAEKRLAGAPDVGQAAIAPERAAAAELAAAADAPAVGPGGGGAAGVRSLPEAQGAAARWAGERQPLEGLPGPLKIGEDFFVPGPIGKIHDDTGSIQSDAPKVPLYAHASGTPETGFQTTGPVGDAHFSRGVGLSDTRKGPTDVQGSFSRAEYQTLQPWWQHDVAGKVGLESVPGQARLWTALGPQTGVDSALGAPKLELLAQQIMVAAKRLRISPERARDLILSGEAGAGMLGGAIAAPVVSGAMRDRERAAGGGVDAAMEIARSIKRAKGGRVHVGPIVGDTGGRADKRPMEVPDGSYVLTADHVSGLGEGNTEAGMKKLGPMFPNSKPSKLRGLKGKAVPIYAADGEFVIHPDDIIDRFGELDYGHRSLDAWQTAERKQLIKTLKNLAPPAQD